MATKSRSRYMKKTQTARSALLAGGCICLYVGIAIFVVGIASLSQGLFFPSNPLLSVPLIVAGLALAAVGVTLFSRGLEMII